MKINDIVTKDGINADFVHWLWGKDRETYALILFGHIELITDDLIKEYEADKERENETYKRNC